MNRRQFHLSAAALLAAPPLPARAQAPAAAGAEDAAWADIEARSGGRLGVAVMQAGSPLRGHRLGERFPMCSTFKWLAAAHVLHRVDGKEERLDRRLRVAPEKLLPNSPVTERHAGGEMTLGALCHATITRSDNAAATLILETLGGPAGLTQYARSLGDEETRLDRWEPALNEAAPGDPRDTTTPRAMAGLLRTALLGEVLSPQSRARLARWLEASQTNGKRLRAGLPAGWRMGSKTGTGSHGSTNDAGIFWPPGQPPILVAAYLTDTEADPERRNAAIAAVARHVARIGGSKPASSSDHRLQSGKNSGRQTPMGGAETGISAGTPSSVRSPTCHQRSTPTSTRSTRSATSPPRRCRSRRRCSASRRACASTRPRTMPPAWPSPTA